MGDPVVAAHGVHFAFNDQPVLEDVHLEVCHGDFLAVLGPNGGGKTTLLKLLLGLLRPQRGVIRVLGDLPGKSSRRVGYVPQQTNIHDVFPITAEDVVLLGRLPHRPKWRGFSGSDNNAVRHALERVGMGGLRHRRIGRLSGGQRQRVLIARALVNAPEILFLDEPTASVDRHFQTEFYDLLKELNASMTIIVVSHDLFVLSAYAKSVACVNRTLFYHDAAELTQNMLKAAYHCPVEVVAHGPLPHRVLQDHSCRHD